MCYNKEMGTSRPQNQTKVIGILEKIRFPAFSNSEVVAKIDTGAYSGALHCTRIEERQVEGGTQLVFCPLESDKEYVYDEYWTKHVRSSNGERQERQFITTTIEVHGKTYEILLSLTDRSDMKWQVLIGRRFLKDNHFVVDPKKVTK